MKETLLKIIKFGAILALFTPFVFAKDFFYPYIGPKSLYFMGLAEMIFFAWLVLAIKFPQYRPRFNPLTIALVFLLAVLAISAVFGANWSQSFWSKFERMTGVLMMAHLFAFFLAASSTLEKKDWLFLFKASVLLAAAMGMLSIFDVEQVAHGGGAIGNDSFLGTYLALNIFLAVYLFFGSGGEDKRSLLGVKSYAFLCFLAMIVPLFRSGARAAQISLLGGLALIFLLWMVFRKQGKIRLAGLVLSAVLLVSGVATIYLSTRPDSIVYQKMEQRFRAETIYGRLVVWEIAWKSFLDRPLLGWGPENFELAFTKNYNPCLGNDTKECGNEIWYDRAHNVFFDTLAATGIIGLFAYAGVFLSAIYVLWKKYSADRKFFWEAGVVTTAFISYQVQNLTVFDTVVSYFTLFLILGFIGSMENRLSGKKGPKEWGRPVKWPLAASLAVLFAVFFVNFIINPAKADHYVVDATEQLYGGKERIDAYQKALDASPAGKFQIRTFFASTLLNYLNKYQGQLSVEGQANEYAFLCRELEKSVEESPGDFRSYLILGQLYERWYLIDDSKLPLAERALEKAVEVAPRNQQGYWQLAQVRVYQGRMDDAMAVAQKALDLEPNFSQSKRLVNEIKRVQSVIDEQQQNQKSQ